MYAVTDKGGEYRGPEWSTKPLIYLPKTVSSAKASRLREQGAQLVLHGDDSVEAEREARRAAAERGMTYVSPYNDPQVSSSRNDNAYYYYILFLPGARCFSGRAEDEGIKKISTIIGLSCYTGVLPLTSAAMREDIPTLSTGALEDSYWVSPQKTVSKTLNC